MHADRLRERLQPSVKTVHVLVDGGLYPDTMDRNGDHTMSGILQDVFHLHHIHRKFQTSSVDLCFIYLAFGSQVWSLLCWFTRFVMVK